jgi:hypothetical protein
MTDAPPDYTTMSGAEFQRAVGTDPERWAEAFCQTVKLRGFEPDLVGSWFRDAMHAAVAAHPTVVVALNDWDAPEEPNAR